MSKRQVFILSFLVLGLAACATSSERHVKRGYRYLSSGQLVNAEREFRKAVQKDRENPQAYFGLGYAYFRENELDKAIFTYKQGIMIDPNDSDSHYYLGLIYNEKNMRKDAREEFKLFEKLKRSRSR